MKNKANKTILVPTIYPTCLHLPVEHTSIYPDLLYQQRKINNMYIIQKDDFAIKFSTGSV